MVTASFVNRSGMVKPPPLVQFTTTAAISRTTCRRVAFMVTNTGMPCDVTPPYVFPTAAALGVTTLAGDAVAIGIIGVPMTRAHAAAPTTVACQYLNFTRTVIPVRLSGLGRPSVFAGRRRDSTGGRRLSDLK